MAEISPEMMAKLQTFRRAKRTRDRQRVGQAIGGIGGTARGDLGAFDRLAPERKWDAEREQFLARMREQAGMVRDISKEEQFYYNQEQQERLAILSDMAQEMQRLSQIAQTNARLSQQGAQARANLQGAALLKDAMLIERELRDSYGLSPAGQAAHAQLVREGKVPRTDIRRLEDKHVGEAILPYLPEGAQDELIARGALVQDGVDPETGEPTYTPAPGVRASELGAISGLGRQELSVLQSEGRARAAQAQATALQEAGVVDPGAAVADSLRQIMLDTELSDHDKHNLMVSVATPEQISSIIGEKDWNGIKQAHDSNQESLDLVLREKMGEYVTTAGQTFGGQVEKYLGDLPNMMERYNQATEMAKKTSPLKGEDLDGDGIPDIDWAPSAEGRFVQILDQIEAYPDQPPVKWAKSQIMGSPEFQQFQKQYGYEDPDFAFREMNRLTRAKMREQKRTSRRNAALHRKMRTGPYAALNPNQAGFNATTGMATQDTAGPKPKKKTDADDVVAGAAGSRIAEN